MHAFLTHKSGKFYFREEYSENEINNLLINATILNEIIVELPILPEFSAKIDPDIMFSSISGTARIEGNAITSDDAKRIAAGEDLPTYTKKDKQEILNLVSAYKVLSNMEFEKAPIILSEDLIKKIHKIITSDIPDEHNVPGQYRNGLVKVGDNTHGGTYTPPKVLDDIKNLMSEFIKWINSDKILNLNPFIRAALAHYHFCLIHPFWDGNGRTSRIIEALLLQSADIRYLPKVLSNCYYKDIDGYHNAFSKSINKKNSTHFIKFMLTASVEGLRQIKSSIIFFIRRLSLLDYYNSNKNNNNINQRQFDLLNLLLDRNISISLNDLQQKIPFTYLYHKLTPQTARRDLRKLTDMELLNIDENGQYTLNFYVLG